MLKNSFLLLALTLPLTSWAQIQIGDIKVDSLADLFDKQNKTYWKNEVIFQRSDSRIWMADLPSMIVESEGVTLVSLAVKKDINQDSVRNYLIEKLTEQFGDFEKTDNLPLIDSASLEWKTMEDGEEYIFSMSQDKGIDALFIIRR